VPSDILREREGGDAPNAVERAGDDNVTPPSSSSGGGFADLSLSTRISENDAALKAARDERAKRAEAEQAAMAKRDAAMAPLVTQAREQISQPMPAPPAPVNIPQPPSRKLSDFLAAQPGETPENTISKLLQGISVMATGLTGLRRGTAGPALAAMKGALEGWQAGDKQRADRHFADWKAESDRLFTEWETQQVRYRDILADKKLSVDAALKALELAAIEHGNQVVAASAAKGDVDATIKQLSDDRHQLMALKKDADHLDAMARMKRENIELVASLKEDRANQAAADTQKAVDGLDGDSLRRWGKDYMLTGKVPSIGQGGKGQAVAIRSAIVKAEIAWAKENGLDPMEFDAIRAEVAGDRGALVSLKRKNADQEAALERLEPHLKTLIRLSDAVPRSEIPAVNAAIVRGEKDYKGSPEAAEYVAQAVEAAMEQARVQVPGGAQGDAASREEVRKTISPSLSPLQIKAVANRYLQNGRQSIEANKAKEKEISARIDNLNGRIAGPPIHPPPMGTPDDPLGILGKK